MTRALDDFDVLALNRRAAALRQDYLAATPWPHVVLHDLVAPAALARVRAECARTVEQVPMIEAHGSAQHKRETGTGLGPLTLGLLSALESDPFREVLEAITGVPDLRPDPDRVHAGLHQTQPGGFTLVHRDFRQHPRTGLHHRVNVLLYLNERWDPSWGGALELWPGDMSAVGRRIVPSGNTLVVWETHDQTLHGLPEPVTCPPGHSRLSLASYWYSEQPRTEPTARRRPVFARRAQDPWWVGRRRPRQVVKDLVSRRPSF